MHLSENHDPARRTCALVVAEDGAPMSRSNMIRVNHFRARFSFVVFLLSLFVFGDLTIVCSNAVVCKNWSQHFMSSITAAQKSDSTFFHSRFRDAFFRMRF
eukprot:SAG31_NODE_1544_length_7943_cov_4.076237_6_plen_101_part_00